MTMRRGFRSADMMTKYKPTGEEKWNVWIERLTDAEVRSRSDEKNPLERRQKGESDAFYIFAL
jgi:hypothetical protein